MTRWRLAGSCGLVFLLAAIPPSTLAAAESTNATIFRIFLNDGTALISYGELARIGERVVFSMPTTAALDNPSLHLVNIGADLVDWTRTNRYAEAARAERYRATRAEDDYARLTTDIAAALAEVSRSNDASARLAIVERARRALADWPPTHYGYKQVEVGHMIGMVDEIIAELRAAAGIERFDLAFVAGLEDAPAHDPLLPLPTPKEVIEQTVTAARFAESSTERVSLFAVALGSLERDAESLPTDWRTDTQRTIRGAIAVELDVDRRYQALSRKMLSTANARARAADVRGVQQVLSDIVGADLDMGTLRPDAIAGLVAAVEAELDAARRLRLARDRWELKQPEFSRYSNQMTSSLERLSLLQVPLEDIKALAGSSPDALGAITRGTAQVLKSLAAIVPPNELTSAHALFVTAAQLADSAARIRREAALTEDLQRAWDASSAASGALMLEAKARSELFALLRRPQFSR